MYVAAAASSHTGSTTTVTFPCAGTRGVTLAAAAAAPSLLSGENRGILHGVAVEALSAGARAKFRFPVMAGNGYTNSVKTPTVVEKPLECSLLQCVQRMSSDWGATGKPSGTEEVLSPEFAREKPSALCYDKGFWLHWRCLQADGS